MNASMFQSLIGIYGNFNRLSAFNIGDTVATSVSIPNRDLWEFQREEQARQLDLQSKQVSIPNRDLWEFQLYRSDADSARCHVSIPNRDLWEFQHCWRNAPAAD